MDAYNVLAQRLDLGASELFRKVLEFMMTPKQAELVTYLPASFEDLAQKSGLSVDEVKREIDDLFRKGVVIPKDFQTLEGARFPRSVGQLHDAVLGDRRTEDIYGAKATELWRLWEDFSVKEWHPKQAEVYRAKEHPVWRVIPAYKAIENIPGVTEFDDVRAILKAAPSIATVPCSCRRAAQKTDVAVNT